MSIIKRIALAAATLGMIGVVVATSGCCCTCDTQSSGFALPVEATVAGARAEPNVDVPNVGNVVVAGQRF